MTGAEPNPLSKRLPLAAVAQVAELPVEHPIIPPLWTVCPSCQQHQLYVTEDEPNHGVWFHCFACELSGDGLMLAHLAMNPGDDIGTLLDGIELTVRELIREGALGPHCHIEIDQIERYRRWLHRFLRVRGFWADSRKNAMAAPPAAVIETLTARRTWPGYDPKLWPKTMGRLVGVTTTESCMRQLDGIASRRPLERLPHRKSDAFVVVPFFADWGRISAFLLLSRDGTDVFLLVDPGADDHGIGLMHAVRPFEEAIYATDSVDLALQLHCRHFAARRTVLPLVTWLPLTHNAWQALKARKVIVHSAELSPAVGSQARTAAGQVSVPLRPVEEVLEHRGPASVLRAIRKAAAPWTIAARNLLLQHKDPEMSLLVHRLRLRPPEKVRVINTCTNREERDRVARHLRYDFCENQVIHGGKRFFERDGAWFIRTPHGNELASNVVLRIEKSVHDPDTNRTTLTGRLLFHGEEITFRVPEPILEQNPARWVETFLMERGRPRPTIGMHYRKSLLTLAQLFCPVAAETAPSRVGWSDELKRFIFPRFAVRDGTIRRDEGLSIAGIDHPGWELDHQAITSDMLRPLIEDTPFNVLYWASFAVITANILAPAYGKPTLGIVAVRDAAAWDMLARMAADLGVLRMELDRHHRVDVDRIMEFEFRHGYPVVIDHKAAAKRVIWNWMNRPGPHNAIVGLDLNQALAAELLPGWLIVRGSGSAAAGQWVSPGPLLVDFLAHLQRHNYGLPEAPNLPESVVKAVWSWFRECSGRPVRPVFRAAEAALEVHELDGQHASARTFLKVLFRLADEGLLSIGEGRFNKHNEHPVMIDGRLGQVFLKRKAIFRVFRERCLALPDVNVLTEGLRQEGFLVEGRGLPCTGWFLDRERWKVAYGVLGGRRPGRVGAE